MFKFQLPWKRKNTDMFIPDTSLHFLIFGLGNPGQQYRENRHNVGFKTVDALAKRLEIRLMRVQFKAMWGSGTYAGKKITLVKPQTFMNLSGQAVVSYVHYYKISMQNVIVIYDDMDLPFGTIRVRSAGSSGGQNGVESIIEKLGTKDFPRLRVGIGRPPGRMQGLDYVLQDFNRQEQAELDIVLERACSAVQTFIEFGINRAMTEFNGVSDHVE